MLHLHSHLSTCPCIHICPGVPCDSAGMQHAACSMACSAAPQPAALPAPTHPACRSGVCGNGICEVAERTVQGLLNGTCPQDCAFETKVCGGWGAASCAGRRLGVLCWAYCAGRWLGWAGQSAHAACWVGRWRCSNVGCAAAPMPGFCLHAVLSMLATPLPVPQSCPATCGGGLCLPTSGTCECYAANSGPSCQDCAAGFTQVRPLAGWLLGRGALQATDCMASSRCCLPTLQPPLMPLLPFLLTLQVNGACVGDVVALGLVPPNPAEPPSGGNTNGSGTKSEARRGGGGGGGGGCLGGCPEDCLLSPLLLS